MESRVLVSARKFKELGAATGPDLAEPKTIDARARTLQAADTEASDDAPPGAGDHPVEGGSGRQQLADGA